MIDRDRDALILELRRNGATQEQIADRIGVTQQRVSQKIQRLDGKARAGSGRPCPKCGMGSCIKLTRHLKTYTKRRHECLACKYRWTSRQIDDE